MQQKDFSGATTSDINVSLAPTNTVELGLNVDFDTEIGSAVSRLGRATVGAQITAAMNILGLAQHIDTDTASNNKLFATLNASGGATSVIYEVGVGNSLTGLTANLKARYLTFLKETLMVNGTETKSWDGTNWTTGTALNLSNIPSGHKYCIEFLDRVYLAGNTSTPTRLIYSGVSNGSAISWISGNGYVDIEPEDSGGPITALGKVPGYILVFKERSMHRWNYSSAFPESMIQIGTPSQESVIMGGGLCAFYSNSNENAKGFYITNGSRPVCISQDNNRPIKKWVDAIASGSEANIAGWATDRHFCWSVGDLTVDGETFNNVVLKYNRKLNQWSIRTYPTEFKVFAQYLVSSVNTTVGGDDDGTIYRVDQAGLYTDAVKATTQNFPFKVRQHFQNYGDNHKKVISDKVAVKGKNLNSIRCVAYVDEDNLNPISLDKDPLSTKSLALFKVGKEIHGNTIAIEVAGESAGSPVIIREIDMPKIAIQNTYL